MVAPGRQALWGITAYFNPLGYERRLRNYRLFRRHLAVPLVTVELAFGDEFQLRGDDAEVLLQIRDGDVLWQKERLLNLALTRIPEVCEQVAWLDCDIVFADADWAERASRALERHALVHLFHERHDLPSEASPDRLPEWRGPATSHSVVYRMTTGEATPADLFESNAPLERRSTAGLAWASPRAVLERHGLYDACILGSGDRAILCAALGQFEHGVRALLMTGRRRDHYLRWARAYHGTVQGRVGHIAGRVFHLWHGDLTERRYQERHRGLEAFGFDPITDVRASDGGAWRWNSGKPGLHELAREYFASRNEDGTRPVARAPRPS